MVIVKDCFALDECVRLEIHTSDMVTRLPVFYFHELQYYIYKVTGQMLLTHMGKRLMLTRRAIEP
jgi:hypothetical protein